MDLFNFYFSFFGLLLGLAAAEVAGGFANAVQGRRKVPIGALTLLLGLFVLIDLSSFWRWAWSNREFVSLRGLMIEASLLVTLPYYLAASLVFPRPGETRANLDEHYRANKRFVVAGVLIANLMVFAFNTSHYGLPPATEPLAWLGLLTFYVPLAALLFTRGKRIDVALLAVLVAHFVITNAYRISGEG
jgi:hypothetical protein